ncbi:Restriction endonuclease S subunit [Methanonatronarchaeum thermophilum]|uniref:Restriction endonuclease S subunit n=1 Tax=Methanonatronarchaeum thermophilum TaxID=1927129 RepID=A0A1Y3G9C4_9EURY|nr:restriction endonuclease subunit S [Methanonatronarchaeum thermophilum]OUJ18042.1 Restriction endonuclease S subunit [Methanonatronarchaeum thermophilum]
MNKQKKLHEATNDLEKEYKGIQIVEITPNDWDILKFNETCHIQSGLSWSKDQEVESPEEGDIAVIKINNVLDGKLDLKNPLHLKDVTDEQIEKNKARKNWLIMIGSNGSQERIAKCGLIKEDMDFVFASFLYGIKSKVSNLNSYFLYYLLNSDKVQKRLQSFTSGSTSLNNLNKSILEKLVIPAPKISEQRKIASVLYNVDQAIQKTDEIIEQTQKVKKGLMQDLFTEGYYNHEEFKEASRFSKIPIKWEVEKINQISDVIGGGTPSTKNEDFWGGEIPWITPSELTELDSNIVSKTERYITEKGLDSCSAKLLPKKSLLLTSRASIGMCVINDVPMATNQGFQSLVPNEDIDIWYLLYRMRFDSPYLNSIGTGSTYSEVSNTMMKKIDIPIPKKEEQKKIGRTIKSTDEQIFSLKKEKDRLHCLKKGLLQDLLTGKVRTKGKDIKVSNEVLEAENA